VSFVVDLQVPRRVAAARIATHQPDASWCHPARIDVALSTDGSTWTEAGSASHDDVWSPPSDDEPWEHEDAPRFAHLPAGGRLAHTFPVILASPAGARFVRVTCVPLEGRGMGLSEIQVVERVEERPWPEDIVHVGSR
jgi:hypothetical protein